MNLAWKYTELGGSPCNGGSGRWHLPVDDKPGAWMPAIKGALMPCRRGYHLCRPAPARDLVSWSGAALWVAQYDGDAVADDNKLVCRRARLVLRVDSWDDRSARLIACDYAERVLPIFERERPDDSRPRDCIATARRFATGEATKDELDAAWDAAGAAAWDAARAAAWAAAKDAEHDWQLAHMIATMRLDDYLARAAELIR